MKNTFILTFLFVVILVGGYLWSSTKDSDNIESPAPIAATSTAVSAMAGSSGSGSQVTYTSAQVATHNVSDDCWASIEGNVYDLTSWIAQHPGGESPILMICGKDGTSMFEGQHGNDGRAQSMLASFKIGTLAS